MRLSQAALLAAIVSTSVLWSTEARAAGNRFPTVVDSRDCRDDAGNLVGTITFRGAKVLWPPNHKYRRAVIAGDAVDGGDSVLLETEASSDEAVDAPGSGHTAEDVSPATDSDEALAGASTAHRLRGERSTEGNGRTYTIRATATFTDTDQDGDLGDTSCTVSFEVDVPRSQKAN